MMSKDIDTLLTRELDDIAGTMGYIDEARVLLENALINTALPKKRHLAWALSMAVGIAAAAGVLFVLFGRNALEVSVEKDGRPLPVGSWVSSSKEEGSVLLFSDGSAVNLAKSSEVRIQELKENGAHLLVERGSVAVSVVHSAKTDWRLDAGPYQIAVTGTRFGVDWIPEKKVFSADVQEGTIAVEGPMLADGKSLSKGDTLHVSILEKVAEIFKKDTYERIISSDKSDTETSSFFADESAVETGKDPAKIAALETAPIASLRRREGKPAQEAGVFWKSLALKGAWRAAVDAAEQMGMKAIISSASLSDLMLLGDAARLAKNYPRAMQVYQAVRTNFPGTSEAQRAAFTMGRIKFEAYGKYADAAEWFSACVRDNAQGTMVREASGRLVEALYRAGDQQGARDAAREYLETFRNGPHARLAKQILSKPDLPQ